MTDGPDWLVWLLSVSDMWPYTVFRLISLAAGLFAFVWAFFAMATERHPFAFTFAVGFGGVLFGCGWPLLAAMHYNLSDCQMRALLIGGWPAAGRNCAAPARTPDPARAVAWWDVNSKIADAQRPAQLA